MSNERPQARSNRPNEEREYLHDQLPNFCDRHPGPITNATLCVSGRAVVCETGRGVLLFPDFMPDKRHSEQVQTLHLALFYPPLSISSRPRPCSEVHRGSELAEDDDRCG